MTENTTKTLAQYLALPGASRFIIPDFQRGYVWGKVRPDHPKNSVEFLLDSLLAGQENEADVFLQGITYTRDKKDGAVVIIDGQQRTTFFYLLLRFLGYTGKFDLTYSIREESNNFLETLVPERWVEEDPDAEFQDVFFFTRTLSIFHKKIGAGDFDRKAFLDYLLEHVKFLCINIDPDKAETIFTMMNGNKAEMRQEELIKAELLRRASLASDNISEVECRDIRGRMAREWDEWLHWWKRDDVKEFFVSGSRLLGWLLPLYLGSESVKFEAFRRKLDKGTINKIKEAKDVFRALRLKQRQLHDAYSNPKIYNYIGAILRMKRNDEDRFTFLRWYFNTEESTPRNEKMEKLKRYFDLTVVGCNHSEITSDSSGEAITAKIEAFYQTLGRPNLYRDAYEDACRWLLRCNILEDCKQGNGDGRKFNFGIWKNRSLEHIYPKSKFGHYNPERPDECLDYNDNPTTSKDIEIFRGMPGDDDYVNEHSIGNLVLLYGNDNSAFGDKVFQEKKAYFFSRDEESRHFESRHLIHTISVFAESEWGRKEIRGRSKTELENFTAAYKIYKSTNIQSTHDGEA